MVDDFHQSPHLDQLYQRYLQDENSAEYVRNVSQAYTLGTLEKLAHFGHRISRRAAVLAIGFIGDIHCNDVLGRALKDSDRAVRLLADHGIRLVWFRVDDLSIRNKLRQACRLNQSERFHEARQISDEILAVDDEVSEAWNQRAIANYALENYHECCCDCWRALEINSFQFPAALGLGHCHMQMNEVAEAIESFQVAVDINPDLENVRAQIHHLQRILEGR